MRLTSVSEGLSAPSGVRGSLRFAAAYGGIVKDRVHLQPDFLQLDLQVGAIHSWKTGWAVFRGGKQTSRSTVRLSRSRARRAQGADVSHRHSATVRGGIQVSQDDTLAANLERRLSAVCAALTADQRLNFGVSGLGRPRSRKRSAIESARSH
jgi:hypothetical protein